MSIMSSMPAKKAFKKKVKLVLQLSNTECGIAALAMLLAYHGTNVSLAVLREKCGYSRDGCKASTLCDVARELGFIVDGYRVELEDIIDLSQPVIAFWGFNHYVVIRGVDNKRVYLNDPSRGAISVSLDEFDKSFTGIVISLSPSNQSVKYERPNPLKTYLKEWMCDYRIEWLFIGLISLFVFCGPLLNSALTSFFINYCLSASNNTWLPWLALISLGLALCMAAVVTIQHYFQFKIVTKASLLKTSTLIMHSLQLPMLYYSLRPKSEIVAVLARAEAVFDTFFKSLARVSANLIMTTLCLVALFNIDFILSLKVLAIIVISNAIVLIMSKANLSYEKNNLHTTGKIYSLIISCLRNIETIKSCACEAEMLARWFALFCQKLHITNTIVSLSNRVNTVNQLCNMLLIIAMLYWGSLDVVSNKVSLGNLLAYYGLLLVFSRNMEVIIQSYKEGQFAFASHLRIIDLKNFTIDPRFEHTTNISSFDSSQPIFKCVNIDFSYNKNSNPTLKHINLEIRPGQQIAFVGATGSGKSTLAKLLCGFYHLEQGVIQLAGVNVKQLNAEDLSNKIAYVSQDANLLAGTIYENLTFGKIDIPLVEIYKVLQLVCLDKMVALNGLYARVGEGGANFSGGEKQRLEIARALLQDTPIIILDEATSALDVDTEKQMMANLRAMDKTIIYIAHRLSTIQQCDLIFVIDKGYIVEQGCHQQLLANQSTYYDLIQAS
jgi:ABC-type bacteriocin/lantibiotic exporter with double-glycine peptidase domain